MFVAIDRRIKFVSALALTLAFVGCTREPIAEFTANAALSELPESHQTGIHDGLRRLFGTSVNPRLRIADPEAPEPEEGEPTPLIDDGDPRHLRHGAAVYNARCAGCHGITGDGEGPAGEYLRPRPRDYRKGTFKFTSTPYGMKPARHDLVRVIRRGAKGTSMPAFPWMSDADLDAVIDYVIYLSKRGEVEGYVAMMAEEYDEDESIEFYEFLDGLDMVRERWDEASNNVVLAATAEPHYTEETVVSGRKIFLSQGCSKCHGTNGKGQVEWLNPEFLAEQAALPEAEREQINYDAWNEPAPAADLTARMLHGGRRPIDIYRRIHTGINGTPMPSFSSIFAEKPEEIWHLVHYVRHIIEGGDPTAGIDALPIPLAGEETSDVEQTNGSDADSESADDADTTTDEELEPDDSDA